VKMTVGATALLGEGDPGGGEDGVAAIGGCRVDGGEENIVAASTVEVIPAMDSIGRGVVPGAAALIVAVEAAIDRDGNGGIEKSGPKLEMKGATASEEEGCGQGIALDMASVEIEVMGLDIVIGVGGPRRKSNVSVD
jgi:hypothetical protein